MDKIYKVKYWFRMLQEMDNDAISVVSGYRGSGKSNLTIFLQLDYISEFGFKCLRCGHTWICIKKLGNDMFKARQLGIVELCPKCQVKMEKTTKSLIFSI